MDNPDCADKTTTTVGWPGYAACGWKLVASTRATLGLPSTITPPLTY
jgi:hypothetical protein